jgi:transcriptional regulator NrdR family protein
MKCLYCKKGRTEVVNSRKGKSGYDVWRRRKCTICKEVFTTTEDFSHSNLFVVKRNLTRKAFVYEKLFASILTAVTGGKNTDMGDSALLAKDITKSVINDLFVFKSKYVSTKDVIRSSYHQLSLINDYYAKKYAMYSPYRLYVIQGKK